MASSFYERDYRDLQGFLDGLIAAVDNEPSRNAAIQARAALMAAIIENHSGPDQEAHGLSIHHEFIPFADLKRKMHILTKAVSLKELAIFDTIENFFPIKGYSLQKIHYLFP